MRAVRIVALSCLVSCVSGARAEEPLLRLGVATDVHVLADWRDANCRDLERQPEYLEKALRWFDAQKADAVAFLGDMTHTGRIAELERFAAVWNRVFPENRAADGRRVEHLLVTGNHEVGQWPGLWDGFDDARLRKTRLDYDRAHLKATWRRLFGEEYELMWKRTVKGVTFIGCQFPRTGIQEPDIARGISELAADVPVDRPFFYLQHAHPAHSCYCDLGGAVAEQASNAALSRFPNAVALSGHSHNSPCDERSVWQGAYTSIGCGSLAEAGPCYRGIRYENGGAPYMPEYARQSMKCPPQIGNDGRCCLLIEVFRKRLVIRRHALVFDEPLGPDWIVPLPACPDGEYSFARRKAEWRPPQFPAGARLTAEVCTNSPALAGPGLEGKPCLRLVFPHALPSGPSRAFDYAIRVSDGERELRRLYVLDPGYYLPENRVTAKGECLIGLHELPRGKRLVFTVEPRNCYWTAGNSLRCEWPTADADIPLPEHPRPDFERADWVNLNGKWGFGFSSNRLDRTINVPFGWGCPLSGVPDEGDVGWYRRTIEIPAGWEGKRVFVVIGASDYETDVWIDDAHLGRHWGGYLPFEFELTPFVRAGERHVLTVRADDHYEPWHLDGKQGYGNVRGIWQTVYLEARSPDYLESVRFTPDLAAERTCVDLEMGAPASKDLPVTVTFAPETGIPPACGRVPAGEATLSLDVAMREARKWTMEDPYLHAVSVRCGEDAVRSYFGYRSISVVRVPNLDAPYVALNGKPVYLRMPLDQSYTPEGYCTFPSDDYARREITILRDLGLNATRIHIKAEVPRKLYWADRLGVLVMADVPCPPGGDLPDASRGQGVTPGGMLEVERCFKGMLKRDFNHPSVFSWVLFNEMWGLRSRVPLNKPWNVEYLPQTQRQVARLWRMAKAADPTRLIDDNSCAPHNEKGHTRTDLHSWHGYHVGRQWDGVIADEVAKTHPGSGWRYVDGCSYRGNEPNINAECGNVWGVQGGAGDSDWSWDYHLMMNAFRRHLKCAGWCYTELHDVPGEWNGYVRYDRTPKEPGFAGLCSGMSLRDLHADAYLLLGRELGRTFSEGERCRIPVVLSLTTDVLCGRRVRLSGEMRWHDDCGRFCVRRVPTERAGQDLLFTAPAWTNASVDEIDVELPKGPAAGTIAFLLNDGARVVARNFMCFAVTNGASSARRVSIGPNAHASACWSEPVRGRPTGVEKTSGGGTGYFEYVFDDGTLPEDRPLVFRAECSTKRVYARDRGDVRGVDDTVAFGLDFSSGDPGKKLSTCTMTGAHPYAGSVRVSANGVFLNRVELPDEPADHRGILSWMAQEQPATGKAPSYRDAGSYGYLVEVEIPVEVRRRGGPLRVRLDVEKTGLAVYGARFGRYPFDPHVAAKP